MEKNIQKEEPKNELEECKQKCDEYLNNWKRATADLINYKKEEMERMAKLMQYSKEDLIEKFLPIIDSIYLAAKHIQDDGLIQIQKQIEEFLKKEGIEEITTLGQKFNPETMEAVDEIFNDQFPIPNTVVEELQKGYVIQGKVLRPARVKVSK